MTRGHTPPPTLTSEDIVSLAMVRKDIWMSAAQGFVIGASGSYLLHRTADYLANQRQLLPNVLRLNRNTAFASVMIGSALGSFLFATSTGKNEVHHLHPIFQRGSRPLAVANENGATDSYNPQRLQQRLTGGIEYDPDRLERERNRIMRRASLNQAIRHAGHGLNDSHGGTWVQEQQHGGGDGETTTFRKE